MSLTKPSAPAPFVPNPDLTFKPVFKEGVKGKHSYNNVEFDLNPLFYADKDTAAWLVKKFGAQYSYEKDMNMQDPIPPQFFLVFPAGALLREADGGWVTNPERFEINAGLLAGFYERQSPKDFPDSVFSSLAERFVWAELIKAAFGY